MASLPLSVSPFSTRLHRKTHMSCLSRCCIDHDNLLTCSGASGSKFVFKSLTKHDLNSHAILPPATTTTQHRAAHTCFCLSAHWRGYIPLIWIVTQRAAKKQKIRDRNKWRTVYATGHTPHHLVVRFSRQTPFSTLHGSPMSSSAGSTMAQEDGSEAPSSTKTTVVIGNLKR